MLCNAELFLSIWGNKSYFVNWGGLLCPPPGDLSNPGIEPESVTSSCIGWQVLLPLAPPGKPIKINNVSLINQEIRNINII